MGRPKKTDEEKAATKLKTKKPKAPRKIRKPKEIELIEVIDEETQINIHVQLNDENEINDIELLDGNTQEYQPEPVHYVERQLPEDPELIQTKEGNMLIVSKDETEVEHVCGKCEKSYKTFKGLKRHLPSCRSIIEQIEPTVIEIPPPSAPPEVPEEIDYSEIQDELSKNMEHPKVVKNPNFEKYCNPQPSHPCYCCDEDVSTAHSGHIRCKQCPKSFKTNNSFRKHMNSVHSTCKDFACEMCNSQCPTQEIFDLHMTTHQTGKPFSCTQCGKDFTRKYHLDRHLLHSKCKGATVDQQKMLNCEVCNREFSRVDNLREHLRGHMGMGVRRRDYQCPYCAKSFFGSSLLNIHIRSHTGEKPFPCDLCPKSFPSNGALRKHYRTHTGEKPYECKECHTRFSAKETLNRHTKTHTGIRPHKCDQCDAAFIQRTQLKAHQFVHTGIPLHNCPQCSKSFSRKNILTEHIKYDHDGCKPYECKYCPKTYKRKDDFIRHWKAHKGIKSHHCDVCKKSFSLKASLRIHERVHSIETPAQCHVCSKQFLRNDCLQRHIRQKHLDSESSQVVFEIYTVGNDNNDENLKIVTKGSNHPTVVFMPGIPEEEEQPQEPEACNSQVTIINETLTFNETVVETIKAENPAQVVVLKHETVEEAPTATTEMDVNVAQDVEEIEEGEILMSQIFSDTPICMDDTTLTKRIQDLLLMLVDEETLTELGWPNKEVGELLNAIITNCGHQPVIEMDDASADESTKLRENTKLLFTLVIDNDHVKSLLNNYTVDEVIHYVLKIGKI